MQLCSWLYIGILECCYMSSLDLMEKTPSLSTTSQEVVGKGERERKEEKMDKATGKKESYSKGMNWRVRKTEKE